MANLEVPRSGVVSDLRAMAAVDTAFADLYEQRAGRLMPMDLGAAQQAARTSLEREIARLMSHVRTAVDACDWRRLGELTEEVAGCSRALAEDASTRRRSTRSGGLGALVDPFSPGLSGVAGIPERELSALRDAAVVRLERLGAADPAWADFYDARRNALARVRLPAVGAGPQPPPTAPALERPFPREVCDRAARLGLVPRAVASTFEEIRARFNPSWSAPLDRPSGEAVRLSVTIPEGTDEPLRDNLTVFMSRVFLTSAGTRYIPWCVAEDVLVEDFAEPGDAASPLLAALGLSGRSGLSRSTIERALRGAGTQVVTDLGLDPREYRIACVPADVYTRLGASLGWGRKEIWTHFDGYMASAERKLMPLAGGDVRFGGLHDVVAVAQGYDSDRLIARFAVVQRRRFAAW